jgi:hypothetical protein
MPYLEKTERPKVFFQSRRINSIMELMHIDGPVTYLTQAYASVEKMIPGMDHDIDHIKAMRRKTDFHALDDGFP